MGVWSPALVPLSHNFFFFFFWCYAADQTSLLLPFPGAFRWLRRKIFKILWHGNEAPKMAAWLMATGTEISCLPGHQAYPSPFLTDTVKNDLPDVIPPLERREPLWAKSDFWLVETRHQCLWQLLYCHSDWRSLVWSQMMHINHVFKKEASFIV